MIRLAAAALLFSAPFLCFAQSVYKCTDANGTVVFSKYPCGKDAKEIPLDVSRTPPAGAKSTDTAVRAISDAVADSDCRRAANNLRDSASQARIDEINRRHWVGSSAAQRQTMRRMDEQEALSLQARVDESQKHVNDALADCDKQKAAADAARTPTP